ncbi:repressor phrH2 [Salarchaeum japonicum]|uniref:repressor phrH2 n=1 Tax=Salarchaeum japonicum TaxID=555573 RepID=UPI003C746417
MARRTGIWMEVLDDRILEYLATDAAATPETIARSRRRPVSTRKIRERLRVLSQAGYVKPLSDDYEVYELTIWGRLYLDGEARADQLVPEPDERRPGHVLG